VADPKSIHPEASYHARLPVNDTNASTRHAPHPSSGLPQKPDSAARTLSYLCAAPPSTVPRCLPESRSADILQSPRPPTPRHGPAERRPFEPEPGGRRPFDIKTWQPLAAATGVLSARSRRHGVVVFRGTGFGSAPRRWGRHIGVCDAGPTVSALTAPETMWGLHPNVERPPRDGGGPVGGGQHRGRRGVCRGTLWLRITSRRNRTRLMLFSSSRSASSL
jgi:hypothetical protein